MNKIVSFGLVIGAMISLIGCGGGGTPTTSAVVEKGLGTYNDSAVSGVSYTCGTETGVTDANGTFTYDIGASCTFSIEDIVLSIIGSSSLSDENATILVEDIAVAQFLQSIDLDGDASNGITITPEIIDVLIEGNVTTLPSNLEELEAAVTLLEDAAAEDNSTLEYTGTVVTEEEAEAHLEDTKATLDVTAPVITIAGNNPLIITQDVTNFSAPESNVTDDFYDDINATVTGLGMLNTAVPGTYTLTYTAVDGAGNSSSKALTVIVQDITIPVITLSGATPQTLEVKTAYVELGATAVDNTDGDISSNISIDASAVDTNTLGSYTVTYNVQDAAGNEATQVTRTVSVLDTVAPVITLNGDVVVTLSVGDSYVEAGVTVTDNSGETIVAQITGAVDTATPGTYTVYYDAADSSSNVATQVTRTVNVVDVVAPVVTLTGINPQELEVNTGYVELGATANDAIDGARQVSIDTADVDMSTLGEYIVTYSSTDEAGNRGEATRTVNVVDTTAPVITLIGSASISLVEGAVFEDEGVICTDNYDAECTVTESGTVNTAFIGSYTITYNATDSNGNTALEVSRTVEVVENTAPAFILPSTYYFDIKLDTEWNNGQEYSQFNAEQFNFSADELSFTNLIFMDGAFISDSNGDNNNSGYVLDNGVWIPESDTLSMVLSVNDTVAILDGIHKLTISTIEDIEAEVVVIDGTEVNVTMPAGAERTTMIHEIIADQYGIDEQARTNGNTANEFYLSLSEVVQYQCGTHWFTDAKEGSGIKGISFTCGQESQISGTLVGVNSDNTLSTADIGTWEIITLPGSQLEAIVVNINSTYQPYSDQPLFAENNGEIWRGWYDASGLIEDMAFYNQIAFDAFTDKIIELEASIVGQTKYFVSSEGITGYRSYATDDSYTGELTLVDGTVLAVSGTYEIVGNVLTLNRTSPNTATLVLTHPGEEVAGGVVVLVTFNGGEPSESVSFSTEAERDAYIASLQAELEASIVGQTKYFVSSEGITGYRSYATDDSYTGELTLVDGTVLAVSGTYEIVGNVLTLNRTSPNTATLVLTHPGEEVAGGVVVLVTLNGGEPSESVSFSTEVERDAYIASLQAGTPTLESLIVGETYYVTTCDHVETLVFGTDGQATVTGIENGLEYSETYDYSIEGGVATVIIPDEGTHTFTNPVVLTDWIAFTDAEGQETGRFFFDYNTAEGTLSYDCANSQIPITEVMLSGETFYNIDYNPGETGYGAMTFTTTEGTRHEIWYYDTNGSVKTDATFSFPVALVDGKIQADVGGDYYYFALTSDDVTTWTLLREEDWGKDGVINNTRTETWYLSKPVDYPDSL